MGNNPINIGLEVLLLQKLKVLKNKKFALLANQASVDKELNYTWEVLNSAFPGQLKALFSPQHGLWSEQQANMIETPHGYHPTLKIPVYSLYSQVRWPEPEMLKEIEYLVIDLQDVGTRVYTFIWTVMYCLEACAKSGIKVIILDRPNPLGGEVFEGQLVEKDFFSFVGRMSIPMRHGLTIAELALFIKKENALPVELEVIPLEGWKRNMLFSDLQRRWIPTSPNLPNFNAVNLYPGQVLLEGTNLSEGRGTTNPFEFIGAPFVDPFSLANELSTLKLEGIKFLPIKFSPTFDKWQGKSCGGIFLAITDPLVFQPFITTVSILACINHLWPDQFQWTPPPYEYEKQKMPIDILSGNSKLRNFIRAHNKTSNENIDEISKINTSAWQKKIESVRLY